MKAIDHFAARKVITAITFTVLAIIAVFVQYFSVQLFKSKFAVFLDGNPNSSASFAGAIIPLFIMCATPVIILLALSVVNFVQGVKIYTKNFSNYEYSMNSRKDIREEVRFEQERKFAFLPPVVLSLTVLSIISSNTIGLVISMFSVPIFIILSLSPKSVDFLTQERVNLRNHFIIEEYGVNDGLDYICALDGEDSVDENVAQLIKDEEEEESLKRFHEKTITVEEVLNWNKDRDDSE